MAQFWIDPSNFDGANWSYWAMQGSPRNLVVGDDGGTPALQFVGGGAFDYTAALYTPAGGSANAEVFLLMRITDQDGTGKAGGVVWADPTAGDAYYIDQNYDDSAYFFRFDGGSRSNFANAGYARGIVYFNSRFRVTQGAGGEALLKYKAWDLGAPEPAGWITEEADSVLAAPGQTGVFIRERNAVYIAGIGIGTNGDPAPTSAPTTGTGFSTALAPTLAAAALQPSTSAIGTASAAIPTIAQAIAAPAGLSAGLNTQATPVLAQSSTIALAAQFGVSATAAVSASNATGQPLAAQAGNAPAITPTLASAVAQPLNLSAGFTATPTPSAAQSVTVALSAQGGVSASLAPALATANGQNLGITAGTSSDFTANLVPSLATAQSPLLVLNVGFNDGTTASTGQSNLQATLASIGHSAQAHSVIANAQGRLLELLAGMSTSAEPALSTGNGLSLAVVTGNNEQFLVALAPAQASAQGTELGQQIGQIQSLATTLAQGTTVPLTTIAGSAMLATLAPQAATATLLPLNLVSGVAESATAAPATTGHLTLDATTGQRLTLAPAQAAAQGQPLQLFTGLVIGRFRTTSLVDRTPNRSLVAHQPRYSIKVLS